MFLAFVILLFIGHPNQSPPDSQYSFQIFIILGSSDFLVAFHYQIFCLLAVIHKYFISWILAINPHFSYSPIHFLAIYSISSLSFTISAWSSANWNVYIYCFSNVISYFMAFPFSYMQGLRYIDSEDWKYTASIAQSFWYWEVSMKSYCSA